MEQKYIGYFFIFMGIAMSLYILYHFFREVEPRLKRRRDIPLYFASQVICWFFASFGVSDTAINSLIYPRHNNVPIKLLPGTIIVGATAPLCFMSYSYLFNASVSVVTLFILIGAQALGSLIGARIVKRMNEHALRMAISVALILTAAMLFIKLFILRIDTGHLTTLSPKQVAIMSLIMVLTGILAMVGFSATTPNMAALLVMGMPPLYIYPIIMSTNCFICFTGCLSFIKARAIHPQVVLIETLGGVVGVFLAMKFVANVNTVALQILMIAVMILSASQMLIVEHRQRQAYR